MTAPLEIWVSQNDPLKHYLKKNDTGPSLRRTLIDPDTGIPYDLTDATAKFIMYTDDKQTEKINTSAVIEDPKTAGIVRYDFTAQNTAAAGSFVAEFEVTLESGQILSFPPANEDETRRYISVKIFDDLGD